MDPSPSAPYPALAIVGRPNVGKSALFNRIVGRRLAIVHEQSGVTRDRVAARAVWNDRHFLAIDTGGLGLLDDERGDDLFDRLIRDQLEVAVAEAARVILVTDAQAGILPLDLEVAEFLRRRGVEPIVAPNKADNEDLADNAAAEFTELGFPMVMPISCEQNRGLDDLIEAATGGFPTGGQAEQSRLRIAVVGKPNVGKSSIVNRLLGEDRVIVSDVAGTTRDAVDVPCFFEWEGHKVPVLLVDTAGMRQRRRVDTVVEYFSMQRTEAAIARADIVVIVLDATAAGTAQDKKICHLVHEAGKACLLLVNKWDLAEMKQKDLLAELAHSLPWMDYASILTCCAVSGYNFAKIVPVLLQLQEELHVEVPTVLVNRVIQDATLRSPPPMTKAGRLKVYYGLCKGQAPPTFLLFVNDKRRCKANYLKYLENQFRRAFGLFGLPIRIDVRERPRDEERKGNKGRR